MKRNRKNSIKKERTIMIASSAFVLAALTMTGVYMRNQSMKPQDDGYTIDFTAMEDSADNKLEEIAQNEGLQQGANQVADAGNHPIEDAPSVLQDDLDYMPMEEELISEAGSSRVEIPGLTDESKSLLEEAAGANEEAAEGVTQDTENPEQQNPEEESQETGAGEPVVAAALHFSEDSALIRPVSGEIILPYSMDGSVYFATLDQYKYNPAMVFAATEGVAVSACAAGQVVSVADSAQLGHTVTLDLGDGYQVIYGQMKDIEVTVGSFVEAGSVIGVVAAPTKYYSMEGSNLYFQLTKDGTPLNPESFF
ncbi:MAG: M23 family metallopeptidase [Roseburia sp.]|nr:M23 family metallopeptidase [Roseburia sp.]